MAYLAVTVCLGWIFSLCLHEFGHAVVAYWGGDTSVKEKGYLTFNPLKYTDPGMSLMLPLFFLLIGGIALPGGAVYINQSRLRSRLWKSAVSAAGPMASIFAAFILASPFWLGMITLEDYNWFWQSLALLVFLDIFIVFINLIPIPPLDGYGIIEPWLPIEIQQQCRKFSNFGILFLIAILWTVEPVNQFLATCSIEIMTRLNVPAFLAFEGLTKFQKNAPFLILGLIILLWVFRSKEKKLYQKARMLINRQKYPEAIEVLNQAIEAKPDFEDAWRDRTYLLHYTQQYEAALNGYKQLSQWQPQNAEIWKERAKLHGHFKQYEEALICLEKALELNPNDEKILELKSYLELAE